MFFSKNFIVSGLPLRSFFFFFAFIFCNLFLKIHFFIYLCICHYKTFTGKRRTLSDINHSKILYDPPPRITEIKAKINKWGLIKLKSFSTTKETISNVKRQPSEWEKIIANEATDKELISKVYKQLLQLNSRKINDPKNGPKN